MSAEPFSKSPSEEAERREAQFRQLVKAAKAVAGSSHGKLLLAHLENMVGFHRCEADSELLTDNQIARRVCMKRIIYEIHRLRDHTFRKDTRPKRALSASHHEKTQAPPSA